MLARLSWAGLGGGFGPFFFSFSLLISVLPPSGYVGWEWLKREIREGSCKYVCVYVCVCE